MTVFQGIRFYSENGHKSRYIKFSEDMDTVVATTVKRIEKEPISSGEGLLMEPNNDV